MSEEQRIVRLFFAKMKPAFYELSQEEQGEFMVKDRANLDRLGMQAISMIDCAGADEEWDFVGVEGWPSKDAISEREAFEQNELNISKYVRYKTIVGIEQTFDDYGK